MGEMVEFASNGSVAQGYLAAPASGSGPGVVVIQEWWGLVDHIKEVCDRFAAEGFVALAPDLYHGAHTTEPDEAGKMLMSLNIDQAAQDLNGAVDRVVAGSSGERIGVIGFCAGGGLALRVGCLRPDAIAAVLAFYGVAGWPPGPSDWSSMTASVQGHYAEHDGMAGPPQVAKLEEELRAQGIEVEMFLYPGTSHAFFNDTRPEVYDADASALAWQRSLDFLRMKLN